MHARFGSGLCILRAPIMQIECLTPSIDWRVFNTLVFTSAAAVQAFSALSDERHFDCYAVGGTTAKAARDIGLSVVDCDGTATDLVETVIAAKVTGRVLYLRGEHVSDDIAATFACTGIEVQSAVVYRQCAMPLALDAVSLLKSDTPVIIPLMSKRSVTLLFDQVQPTAPVFPVAMSANVAAMVPDAYSETLRIAQKPSLDAVLEEVAKQINDVKRLEGH